METDIRAVMNAQRDAWNRGDIEAYMQGYWKSPDVLFASRGTFAQGWQPLLDRYRQNYPDGGMGRLTFDDIVVRPIGDSHAWVTGQWALEMDEANPRGAFTLIFRRLPEGWRIIHDHSSGVPANGLEAE